MLDQSEAPFARWFVGDARDVTYAQLEDEVSKAANALAALGLTAGDRVAVYMSMVPEAIMAHLVGEDLFRSVGMGRLPSLAVGRVSFENWRKLAIAGIEQFVGTRTSAGRRSG